MEVFEAFSGTELACHPPPKGDVLPVPTQSGVGGKTKSMKKEEQYRVMYAELERFLAAHEHSERHAKVGFDQSESL